MEAKFMDDSTVACDSPTLNFEDCDQGVIVLRLLIFRDSIPGSIPLGYDASVECAPSANLGAITPTILTAGFPEAIYRMILPWR
jgi:hypothetical protein